MQISRNDLISALSQIIFGIILLFIVDNIQLAFVLVFVELCFLFFRYVAKGVYENTAYIVFLLCLFTFLIGGFVINISNEAYFRSYSHEGYLHIANCLFLCLACSSVMYDCICKRNKLNEFQPREKDIPKINRIRKAALLVFYVLSVFSVIENGEKALFVLNNSYLQYYTEYVSSLPSVFFNLSAVSQFAFYVFVATMPPKKQYTKPMIWFLLINAMSLGYGQRNGFVLSLLFVVIYYTIRHKLDGEVWVTKKLVVAALVAIPFFVSALYAFNYIRSEQEVKVTGLGNQIVAFFEEQSSSSRIIGYGYEYKDSIKQNGVNYSISQLTNIITQNDIVIMLFGRQGYTGQTAENALYGTNFGYAITYKVMPHNYLAGIGMGTSYVAEAYHDFGYFGVVFINMLYGGLLALFQKKRFATLANNSHPFIIALLLMGLTNILYSPRSIVFGFVSQTLTLTTLIAVCAIQLLSRFMKERH